MNEKQLKEYFAIKSKTQIEKEYIEKIEKQFESKLKTLEIKYRSFKSSRKLIKYFSEKIQTVEGFKLRNTPDWNVSYGYFNLENKLNQRVSCTFDFERNHVWFSVHASCRRLHGLNWVNVTTKKQVDDITETVRSVVSFWTKIEQFCSENKITNIKVGKYNEKNDFEYGTGVRLKLPKTTKSIEFNAYTNTCQCIGETTLKVEYTDGLFNVIQSYVEKK